jgi:hypothetical protein
MAKFLPAIAIFFIGVGSIAFGFTPSGLLEIHYFNVQTAGCAWL